MKPLPDSVSTTEEFKAIIIEMAKDIMIERGMLLPSVFVLSKNRLKPESTLLNIGFLDLPEFLLNDNLGIAFAVTVIEDALKIVYHTGQTPIALAFWLESKFSTLKVRKDQPAPTTEDILKAPTDDVVMVMFEIEGKDSMFISKIKKMGKCVSGAGMIDNIELEDMPLWVTGRSCGPFAGLLNRFMERLKTENN